ncbi:unnamed protein product [marine sediment metagenome]|uniref:HTH arsR-type domain-containing protein n=1 Tax=marine sediment metagenome TaxID=412755 RepID=X1D0X9_9ZZZZ
MIYNTIKDFYEMRSNKKDFSKLFTKSDIIKIKIINFLSDYREHTPSEIALYLGTNTNTILNNCNFLNLIGIVDIDEKKTKRTSYFIKLAEGFEFDLFKKSLSESEN